MILYIDETENEEYFIVTGLLVETEQSVELAYKKFKKSISGIKLSDKEKQKVYLEFKATLLDWKYSRIKIKLLNAINEIDNSVIYSCYVKKTKILNQSLKESVYITLLSNIINSCEEPLNIIFDRFNKHDFEERIVESFSDNDKIESMIAGDSQLIHGLQLVDNICSIIRLYKSNCDEEGFYNILADVIREV